MIFRHDILSYTYTRTGRNGVLWHSARNVTYSYRSAHVHVTRNVEEARSAKEESSEVCSDILSLAQSAQLRKKA